LPFQSECLKRLHGENCGQVVPHLSNSSGSRNETLAVAAMCVSNPDRSQPIITATGASDHWPVTRNFRLH
jgi:hypothetical protein